MGNFIDKTLDDPTYWRSIILFGRNVASYKFALARCLVEVVQNGDDLVRLEDLAAPFARYICQHLQDAPIQATSKSSRFLEACRNFNEGKINETQLRDTTVRLGFNNVIDAFHVVNGEDVPTRFFIDERKTSGGIRLTTSAYNLLNENFSGTLDREIQSRWRLVETAWELNMSRNLISIKHDTDSHTLFVDQGHRRINVTSARDALNGYQKGHCFFCFAPISLTQVELQPDVDHFFPHVLGNYNQHSNYDGVWNLTLSCRDCNRGENGKFAKLPSLKLLERLNTRNEFLITSHHPLRETLIQQTGRTPADRIRYLQQQFDEAKTTLIHEWEPERRGPERF